MVELMNNSSSHAHDSVISLVEEKFERRLTEEISKVREEIHENHTETIRWKKASSSLFHSIENGSKIGYRESRGST